MIRGGSYILYLNHAGVGGIKFEIIDNMNKNMKRKIK